MSIYETMSVPLKYLDSFEKKQHILLLYEDPDYARLLEFRFIKNGLVSGESCLYVTSEDPVSIVVKFLTYGIPLHYFASGKLRVIQVREVHGGQDLMQHCKKEVSKILDSLVPPYRIVGRIVADVSTMEGMSVQMEMEKIAHARFDDLRGSIMCIFDVSKIEHSRRKRWLQELRANHHVVIYAPKFGHGGVFCPC
jgi:hypothetical protein